MLFSSVVPRIGCKVKGCLPLAKLNVYSKAVGNYLFQFGEKCI